MIISSSSSGFRARGFSTKTCLLAFRDSITREAWLLWRVVMRTVSISLSFRIV